MFGLTEQHTYFYYTGICDMRKGFDGLSGLVMDQMKNQPTDGSVYIFINRRRDRMKLLHWQPHGFVLYYKRLEKGTFELPSNNGDSTKLELNHETLLLILRGIRLHDIKRKTRYKKVV